MPGSSSWAATALELTSRNEGFGIGRVRTPGAGSLQESAGTGGFGHGRARGGERGSNAARLPFASRTAGSPKRLLSVLFAALALRAPVVAFSKTGIVRETIREGNGMIAMRLGPEGTEIPSLAHRPRWFRRWPAPACRWIRWGRAQRPGRGCEMWSLEIPSSARMNRNSRSSGLPGKSPDTRPVMTKVPSFSSTRIISTWG